MGISIGLIWNTKHRKRKILRWLFSFQLLLNFTWSIYFFYFQNPFLGFIDILILDIFVIYYMMKSYSIKKMSSLLFIPYILWLLLATYLNGYIMLYNWYVYIIRKVPTYHKPEPSSFYILTKKLSYHFSIFTEVSSSFFQTTSQDNHFIDSASISTIG